MPSSIAATTSHDSFQMTAKPDIHVGPRVELPSRRSPLDVHLSSPPPQVAHCRYYPLYVESPEGPYRIFPSYPPYHIHDCIWVFDQTFHAPFYVIGFDPNFKTMNGWHRIVLRNNWYIKEHGPGTEICYGYVPKDFIKQDSSSFPLWRKFVSKCRDWFKCF
ncbi:hypothetical protein K439DRAFT_1626856 [Ramaria rubella]|nr:hypothetical protein K439DRAFT_1626856 [Ramaria rubella]